MSHTKPGSLLKSQIPVRTFAERDQDRPGFVEIDLVGHEGGDARGEFAYSLCVTDVASGWTEARIVRNRARRWTFEALLDVRRQLPFPLLGIDLRQRRRADQCPPPELVRRTAPHPHAQPRLREERLLLRRAEELERHPPRDRLRPLRHRRGAGPDRGDLRRSPPLRELLPAGRGADRQAAHGRQGLQTLRYGGDTAPAAAGSRRPRRGRRSAPRSAVPGAQSGGPTSAPHRQREEARPDLFPEDAGKKRGGAATA